MSNKIKNGFGITAMSAMATVMATMPIYATSNDEKVLQVKMKELLPFTTRI